MNPLHVNPTRRLAGLLLLPLAVALLALPASAQSNKTSTIIISDSTNSPPVVLTNGAPLKHGAADADDDDDDDGGKKHVASSRIEIHTDSNSWEDILIPLAALAGTFGMPILIVAVVMYFNYRRRQETLATVREYLNKGLPVPPQLLEGAGRESSTIRVDGRSSASCDRRRGFKLTFIGLGVAIALYINNPHSTTWCWGLIPAVMGVGYLLSAWMQDKERPDPRDEIPPPKP